MRKRCKGCRWWEPMPSAVRGEGWGVCGAISTELYADEDDVPQPVIAVIDYDVAVLRTHAIFGCIRWEPADDGS